MSPSVRWVVGCVAVVTLLAGSLAVRHYVTRTQPDSGMSAPRQPGPHVAPGGRPLRGKTETDEGEFEAPPGAGESLPAKIALAPTRPAGPRQPGSAPIIERSEIGTGAMQAPSQAQAPEAAEPSAARPADSKAPALAIGFNGGTPTADQPAPALAKDIQLDPILDATLFPPTALFAYPDRGGIDPEQGTIALWMRMKEPSGPSGRAILDLGAGTWENRLNVAAGPNYVRFLLTTTDGSEVGLLAHVDFTQGDWHNTTVTWGEAQMVLYIDGQAANSTTYSGSFTIPPTALLYVASPRGGFDPSPGVVALRDLRTYQRILTADEIVALVDQTVPSK